MHHCLWHIIVTIEESNFVFLALEYVLIQLTNSFFKGSVCVKWFDILWWAEVYIYCLNIRQKYNYVTQLSVAILNCNLFSFIFPTAVATLPVLPMLTLKVQKLSTLMGEEKKDVSKEDVEVDGKHSTDHINSLMRQASTLQKVKTLPIVPAFKDTYSLCLSVYS